jgi:hypothetical protein
MFYPVMHGHLVKNSIHLEASLLDLSNSFDGSVRAAIGC